jgi:hypothetical protein
MLSYFINRAGRGLMPTRRAELERAKVLLSIAVRKAKDKKAEDKKAKKSEAD